MAGMGIGRTILQCVLFDVVDRKNMLRFGSDESRWQLSFQIVANRYDDHLVNCWVLFKHLFNRIRVNVFSCTHKHVVNATDKEIPTVFVALHHIARVIPTVGKPFGISFRESVVPQHHAFGFHP